MPVSGENEPSAHASEHASEHPPAHQHAHAHHSEGDSDGAAQKHHASHAPSEKKSHHSGQPLTQRLIEYGLIVLLFLIVFVIFTRSLEEAFRILLAFLAMMLIPGVAFARWAFPSWDAWEAGCAGAGIGWGAGSLIMYYLSFVGIKSVQVPWIAFVDLLALIALVYLEKDEEQAS